MMGSHQMTERQVLDAIMAGSPSAPCSKNTSIAMGWKRLPRFFPKGVKVEVGDMLPSSHYADRLKRVAVGLGKRHSK